MKKLITVSMVVVLALGLLLIGNTRADAMNNESAALLAGAIAVFGGAALHAAVYPEPAYPVYYAPSYPVTRVVYGYPGYRGCYAGYRGYWGPRWGAYGRGWRHEWGTGRYYGHGDTWRRWR